MGARVVAIVTIVALVGGCGRLGFDPGADSTSDATVADPDGGGDGGDDAAPFVEPRGVIDPTFGMGGSTITSDGARNIQLFAVVPRAGGYLATGVHATATAIKIGLIGYTVDGLPDVTFDGDGLADLAPALDSFGYGATRLDATRILITGDSADGTSTNDDLTIGLIDDRGIPDPSFGSGGYVRIDFQGLLRADTANSVAVVDGSVIACGISGYDAIDAKFALVRVDQAGALVTTWATGGQLADDFMPGVQDECYDVTSVGGRVIAVGTSDHRVLVVAAYDAVTGARDPTFATGGVFMTGPGSNAYAVAIAGGDLVVVGDSPSGAYVVRLAPDGTPRASFGSNGQVSLAIADYFIDVAVQPNGKLLVAGALGDVGVVARLLADGSLDASFGTGGVLELPVAPRLELRSLALAPDGRIVVVGHRGTADPFAGFATRIE